MGKKFKIDDTRCAPSKNYKNGSCFEYDSLVKIAKAYNDKFTDNIKISQDKNELVNEIDKKLSKECDDQVCWLKQSFTKEILDDSMKNTFRPKGPTQKNGWLSTVNIDEVLNQYHEKYPNFLYLGTVPSDFERLPILGFDKIDYDSLLKKGKYKLGMVINLDEHDQSGSHWVALYINLKDNQIYFFDSYGKKPIKNIKKYIDKIARYLYKKEVGKEIPLKYLEVAFNKMDKLSRPVQEALKKIDLRYNQVQHQRAYSECGVYSINFILRLLKGETFEQITENPIKDSQMEECRETYFNNYKV